jgi:effector-binding domain-containing protein
MQNWAIACYEDGPDGDTVVVHATIVDLPAIEQAATVVHRGSMDNVLSTIQVLAGWIEDNGYRATGYPREFYLECPEDQAHWVTELQEPISPAG